MPQQTSFCKERPKDNLCSPEIDLYQMNDAGGHSRQLSEDPPVGLLLPDHC